MAHRCQTCGAKCCRYFCFEIDAPDSFEEYDDIRWFLLHKGVSIHIDKGDWYISIANRCAMLDRDDRCKLYADRPLICRKYDPGNCDQTGGDYGYDAEFKTPREFEEYVRKVMGPEKYERKKLKAQAKADRTAAEEEAKAGKPGKAAKQRAGRRRA